MSEYTRREMEYRAEQIAHEAQKRLARMEHIVDGLGEVKGEIVRCRDCKHFHEAGLASYTPFCEWMNDADVTPDGFCAWGERKDGDAR